MNRRELLVGLCGLPALGQVTAGENRLDALSALGLKLLSRSTLKGYWVLEVLNGPAIRGVPMSFDVEVLILEYPVPLLRKLVWVRPSLEDMTVDDVPNPMAHLNYCVTGNNDDWTGPQMMAREKVREAFLNYWEPHFRRLGGHPPRGEAQPISVAGGDVEIDREDLLRQLEDVLSGRVRYLRQETAERLGL